MVQASTGYTELHRHLDVSIRTATLLELSQARGLEGQSTSVEGFREKFIMKHPMGSLDEVLGQFTLFQQVLDHPSVLERVAFEAIEDCRNEGIRGIEFRYSPGFVSQLSHLPWEDSLDGFEAGIQRGLEKYPDMRAGLICIASRDLGVDAASRTVEFFLKHQERWIGLDLAGPEEDFPVKLFRSSFRPAIQAGARITVHAGEGTDPEWIWQAIEDLGAQRIGHGVSCVKDPHLMRFLAERKICLEICPTSNWLTRVVSRLEDHPLPQLLRAGVPVTINTDDPGIFGTTLPGERKICREKMRMTEAELNACNEFAREHSFLKATQTSKFALPDPIS